MLTVFELFKFNSITFTHFFKYLLQGTLSSVISISGTNQDNATLTVHSPTSAKRGLSSKEQAKGKVLGPKVLEDDCKSTH